MADTMSRHKRSYGYLFCERLRLSQTTLGDELARRPHYWSAKATSEPGRAGDFLLRVVDGICNCFLALKSLPRVSYQFLMCNYSVLSYLPVVDSIPTLDA
jgi:hypothetical protein